MRAWMMTGLLAFGLIGAVGCGDTAEEEPAGVDEPNNDPNNGFTNNDPNNDPNNEPDAPNNEPNNEPEAPNNDPNNAPACGPPGEPYGTSEGSRFFPLTLNDCDGVPFDFYGEEGGYCEAKLTVVSIGAGWCGPCRLEAEQMQEVLVEAFQDRGVRVLVAITQDNNFGPADGNFCKGWVRQYGLTNKVVIDPLQETNIYFPAGALPSTLIFNNEGVIVHREYGVSDNLVTVQSKLEQLLAEE